MKKLTLILLILLLAFPIMSGCDSKDGNKATLINGIEKQQEAKTMNYNGNVTLKLDFSATTNSMMTSYLQGFSDIKFEFSGRENIESEQSEMEINVNSEYQGMDLVADIPIVIKENVAYIKLPDKFDTLLQMEDKEFIAIDLNQSKEYNQEQALQEKIELLKSIVNGIDEAAISKENAEEFPLTNGTTGEVISINISQDNYKKILAGVYAEAGSSLIELLESYSVTESQKEQTEQLKAKLNDKEELSKLIKDLDEKLVINNFKLTNVYDDKGYQRATVLLANLDIYVEELGQVGVEIKYDIAINEINEEVIFNLPIPSQNLIKELN